MNRLFAVLTAAFLIVGCGQDSQRPSVMPTPSTFALTGTVSVKSDTGEAPLAGVQIDVSDGSSHHSGMTGDDGRYSIDGLVAGQWTVSATKDGYVAQTSPVQLSANASLNFDLQPAVVQPGSFGGSAKPIR